MILSKVKGRLKDDIDMEVFFPVPAQKASTIMAIIKANPVYHEISYEEESAQFNRLFDEIDKAEVIGGSSVGNLWQKLTEEQAILEALRQEKTIDSISTPSGEVREPIATMVYRLKGILVYLDRKALSDNTYEPSAQKIEELINNLMIVGRGRDTRKEVLETE